MHRLRGLLQGFLSHTVSCVLALFISVYWIRYNLWEYKQQIHDHSMFILVGLIWVLYSTVAFGYRVSANYVIAKRKTIFVMMCIQGIS